VAANRDELLDRPAQGPSLWTTPSGRIVAPRDLAAGGTWLGLNPRGVFVAVTNVSCSDPDPQRRSRGLLVVEALAATSARAAADKIESLPMGAYNPFNLFVADAESAFAFSYQDAVRPVPSPDGVFVVGNAPLDAPPPAKLARLRERLAERMQAEGDELLDELSDLCRSHEPGPRGPLDALCVHTPAYGTRSSALLRLGETGLMDSRSVFRFADGAPCQSEYYDHTPLLRDLGALAPGRGRNPVRNVH